MTEVLSDCRALCKPESVCVLFICWRQLPSLTDAMQRAGWTWRGIAVWDKGAGTRPQRGRFRQQAEFIVWGSSGKMPFDRPAHALPGVFSAPNVAGNTRIHQTQKPLDLMRQLVQICAKGGRILDPFAGSGSTLAAAQAEGYDAVGIEINAQIANAAALRLGVSLSRVKVDTEDVV